MTILLFLAVLFVLILVHEWGHFIVAKKTGMRVDEFGIGFPPKLFGRKFGETEYTLNALPIGGFVRIFGENPTDVGFSPVESEVSDRRSEAIAEAGEGGTKSVLGLNSDRARAFGARPKWAQALVLVAGVAMNVLFAWFLMSAALMIGVPVAADPSQPTHNAMLSVAGVLPGTPAAEAGIPIGATISALQSGDDRLLDLTPKSFQEFVVTHGNEAIIVSYDHKGNATTVTLQPSQGVVSEDSDRPAVGVSLAYTTTERHAFLSALWLGAINAAESFVAIAKGLGGLLVKTVSGTADFSQVAGPIGIAGLVGDAAEFGLTSLMLFTAMISLNLAVINLLPVPALDGGRLVFVAIEAITKKEIPPVWMMRVNFAGFAFLMLLMVLVTYGDVTKLL